MRQIILAIIVLCAVVTTGCQEPGLNKKMAIADSLAVSVTATALDESDSFDTHKETILRVAADLLAFVESGNLGQLPLDDVRKLLYRRLAEQGWSKYNYIVDSALTYVSSVNVDTGVIGPNNVIIIKTTLQGVLRQADRSRVEWVTKIR